MGEERTAGGTSMDRGQALELLRSGPGGVAEWNAWRKTAGSDVPSLSFADLSESDLRGVNLADVDLTDASLYGTYLTEAYLRGTGFGRANLSEVDLRAADLRSANLTGAILRGSHVAGANFDNAYFGYTVLACDLSDAVGLELVTHVGPSIIDINALRDWNHSLPQKFLRECGLSEAEVIRGSFLASRPQPPNLF